MDVQFLLRISCFLLIGVTLGEAYFIVRDGKSQCSLAPTNNGGEGENNRAVWIWTEFSELSDH